MKAELLIKYAKEAGFDGYQDYNLSGESELDESVVVGEYPCGEMLNRFADIIIKEFSAQMLLKMVEEDLEIK